MLYVECSISASISHLLFEIFQYFRLVISGILSCPLDPANTLISAEALWQAPEIPGPGEAAMFLWDIYGYIICIKYRLYIYIYIIYMMYVYIHTHIYYIYSYKIYPLSDKPKSANFVSKMFSDPFHPRRIPLPISSSRIGFDRCWRWHWGSQLCQFLLPSGESSTPRQDHWIDLFLMSNESSLWWCCSVL